MKISFQIDQTSDQDLSKYVVNFALSIQKVLACCEQKFFIGVLFDKILTFFLVVQILSTDFPETLWIQRTLKKRVNGAV